MDGIMIMGTAVATSIVCYLSGFREFYILRGPSWRIALSRPDGALNDNYVVYSVSVQTVLSAFFALGLGMFLFAWAGI
jgi:hypothetical protein